MIAVMLDNKLEKKWPEIRFAVDFIMPTLGYTYHYAASLDDVEENEILLCYGLIEPSSQEIAYLAENRIMIFIPCEENLLTLGRLKHDDLNNMVQEIKSYRRVPVISSKKIDMPVLYATSETVYYGKFTFDLLGNIFFHLTAYEDRSATSFDEYGRVKDENIFFTKYSDKPTVNILLELLDDFVKEGVRFKRGFIAQKDFWPQGQQKAAAISITVDSLKKWTTASFLSSTLKDILLFVNITKSIPSLYRKLRFLLTNEEPYWNFDEIAALVKARYPFNLTWFFCLDAVHKLDPDYKLEDADLEQVIANLKGNDIALLGSYDSTTQDTEAIKQKIKFSRIVQKEEIGNKQNHYRYLMDLTTEIHEKAGFLYDASWSFLTENGFKYGIAYPFRQYNYAERKAFNHLQIPTIFSDDKLYLTPNKYVVWEDAKKELVELSEEVKRCNGLATYNFSISNFADIDYLKNLFNLVLEQEKSEQVYKATFAEIANWWQKREKIQVNSTSNSVSIYFPQALEHFSLKIYGNVKVESVSVKNVSVKNNRIHFIDVAANTMVHIQLIKLDAIL